jgi:hypothetical protein
MANAEASRFCDPSSIRPSQDRLRDLILDAFKEFEAELAAAS